VKELRIGVILPMSGSVCGFGQSAYKGFGLQHALTPHLKDGTEIKVILLDKKSDKIESSNAIEKLISSEHLPGQIL